MTINKMEDVIGHVKKMQKVLENKFDTVTNKFKEYTTLEDFDD